MAAPQIFYIRFPINRISLLSVSLMDIENVNGFTFYLFAENNGMSWLACACVLCHIERKIFELHLWNNETNWVWACQLYFKCDNLLLLKKKNKFHIFSDLKNITTSLSILYNFFYNVFNVIDIFNKKIIKFKWKINLNK